MSKEVKIFIGERRLDLYEGVSIPLNFNISDVSEITKRAGSYSKTIKIPATANNNQILGYANDLKSRFREEGEKLEDGALTQIVKETARVEVNGLTIFTGFIKPLGATLNKDGCYSEYSINVFSDNNDWVSDIKDVKLSALDWSDFDHTFSKTVIDTFESNGVGEPVQYPLINFGQFKRTGGSSVGVTDRLPAWNVKRVLENIYSEQGYTVDSDFVNSSFFERLYVPAIGKFEFTDEQIDLLRFNALDNDFSLSSGVPPTLRVIDNWDSDELSNANFNLSTGVYTVPFSANMNFKLDTRIVTGGFGALSWFVELRINGLRVDYAEGSVGRSISIETGTRLFNIGDTIDIRFNLNTASTALNSVAIRGATFKNEVSKEIPEGSNLDFKNFIPDITQLDFIQALTQMFNLYFLANVDTRVVFIEPRDDFYLSSTTAIDWSDKVDNNKNCDIKYLGDNIKKNIVYRYKEDNKDKWVEDWEFQNNEILAYHTEVVENKFTSGKSDKPNKLFAPTLMSTDPKIGLSNTKIPKLWNDVPESTDKPGFSTDFDLRILYFNDIQPTKGGDQWSWDGTIRTDYPDFYSVDESVNNSNSLYFGDEFNSVGLFNRYYKNTHRLINFGKKVILYLNLTDIDILNFDFRRIVYIDGCYYYVETIKDYDTIEKKTTKVELLTLVDLEPIQSSTSTVRSSDNAPTSRNFRSGNARLRSDSSGNIIGGINNDTAGFEDTTLIGTNLEATSKRQLMLGNARILSTEAVDDSPMILTGEVEDCDTGDLTGKPLLQFDRDGNMIVGGGEIYTSFGNPILYNNDVCNLQKIQKDNVNN